VFDPDYSVLFNSHAWSDSEDIIDLVEAVFNDLPLSTQEDLIGQSNNTIVLLMIMLLQVLQI